MTNEQAMIGYFCGGEFVSVNLLVWWIRWGLMEIEDCPLWGGLI